MAKVAVEESLTNVKQALQQNGHQVTSLENLDSCDCCVISGQDKDVMGIAQTTTKAPVINAEGLSADEVLNQINQRVLH